ncbi:AAA family ATPase [Streptomyces sp. NPDC090022]|uniref:AAA family ATPase n=1 Tax=Streptomyces sp. NPDC090022 TaxID=3365920 RepID=UPI00380D4B72
MNDVSALENGTENIELGGQLYMFPDATTTPGWTLITQREIEEAHEEALELEVWFKTEWKRYREERIARRRVAEADPFPVFAEPWVFAFIREGVLQPPSFEKPIRGMGEYETVTPERFTRAELLEGLRRHFQLPDSFEIGDWSEFTDKEREMAEVLRENGFLQLVRLPHTGIADGITLPPTRAAFREALREYNPSVDLGTVENPVRGDRILLLDSAHHLTCPEFGECMECEEEFDRHEFGRGLGTAGKTQTVFGPKEGGKTWYEVLAAMETIQWGHNVLHYEADDSREALPKRLVLAGVDPLDVARYVKVITADEIQLSTDSSGKRRPVTPALSPAFTRNIGLVTLDAVVSMAAELRLDSSSATLTKTLMSSLMEPFYRLSTYGAHGIVVDHSGHDNPDRPMDSAQKLAAVRIAYQARVTKPLGVGRLGCVELILRKDSHSIHPGKRNGDVVAYLEVDSQGDTTRVGVYGQHPDKRSATPAKRGKTAVSSLGEIKAAVHLWLSKLDERTAEKEEIVRGLVGTTKRDGSAMEAKEVRVNLGRINPDKEPFAKLSGDRFRAL